MNDETKPAFAAIAMSERQRPYVQTGMTLREYYAGLAMGAMITKITLLRKDDIIRNRPKDVAELSVLYAETLIAELQKETGNG